MLAFEIMVNGERFVAGAPGSQTLLCNLIAVRSEQGDGFWCTLHVGGSCDADGSGPDDQLIWAEKELATGAELFVRITDTETPDPPLERYRSDQPRLTAEQGREMRHDLYLKLKAEFEPG